MLDAKNSIRIPQDCPAAMSGRSDHMNHLMPQNCRTLFLICVYIILANRIQPMICFNRLEAPNFPDFFLPVPDLQHHLLQLGECGGGFHQVP